MSKLNWNLNLHWNWPLIKQKLREDILALPQFFRNPVQGMRTLPQWEWPTILVLQACFALTCSVLANLMERDFLGMITGIVIGPVINVIMVGVVSGIFYYIFLFFFNRQVPYRQVYIHVLYSSIPVLIVSTVVFLVPPLVLVGSAAALLLLFVGFSDNFLIPKRPLRNLLIGIFAVHVVYWGFQQVQISSKHKTLRLKATPESLDILEKELTE
jgi:hypothetical protein